MRSAIGLSDDVHDEEIAVPRASIYGPGRDWKRPAAVEDPGAWFAAPRARRGDARDCGVEMAAHHAPHPVTMEPQAVRRKDYYHRDDASCAGTATKSL
jgi:hypothetical protein